MVSVNGKILVRSNLSQKDEVVINGVKLKTAGLFDTNYREKSPTIAEVVTGNKFVKSGDIIVCHHNTFYQPSPFFIEQDLFSIPFEKIVFGTLDENGNISPLNGNIICQRTPIDNRPEIPIQYRKTFIDRAEVLDGRWTDYKKGQIILHRLNAGYDIVYNINGVEKRVTKVHESMVVGILQ